MQRGVWRVGRYAWTTVHETTCRRFERSRLVRTEDSWVFRERRGAGGMTGKKKAKVDERQLASLLQMGASRTERMWCNVDTQGVARDGVDGGDSRLLA
jgi:hypothetical protein